MTNNIDPVRALIAKWRSESTSDDQSSDYECGEHSARSECADELEAALASAPPSAPDDVNRLVRELDVALNGPEGAAPQASLCDLISQVQRIVRERGAPLLAPSAPVGVERLRRMVEKLAAHVRPTCSELWEEAQATLAQQPPSAAQQASDLSRSLKLAAAEKQAEAWQAVCALLSELRPGWAAGPDSGQELALAAIRHAIVQQPAAPSGEAWSHYAGSVLTSGADNEASVSFAFSSRDEAERFHEAAIAMLEAAPQQRAGVDGAATDSAVAAIRFALSDPEGMTFLRLWNEGEFDTLRREWPDAPVEVYVGADPLTAQQQEGRDHG